MPGSPPSLLTTFAQQSLTILSGSAAFPLVHATAAKAYWYFSDGLVKNMWLSRALNTKYIYARYQCMASLTAKKVYVVHVCLNTEGVVNSAAEGVANSADGTEPMDRHVQS